MQRYFVSKNNWLDDRITIGKNDAHHINRVMRMGTGDKVICAHPDGIAAICKIVLVDQDHVECTPVEWLEQNVELPLNITIAQGLPKGDKLEHVMQKGTELGACEFIPFEASRSVVKWDDKKTAKKKLRYEKIIKEAAEQSHRTQLPDVQLPMNMQEMIKISAQYDVALFAYEEEAKLTSGHSSLSQAINQLQCGSRVLVVIGPEGGLSEDEVFDMKQNGFIPVRTGPRILRTETAALYVLAAISYHFEEMRCQT